MFASSGLFKDISCPYFLFGLCERPYCHFKHSRQEEAKARLAAETAAAVSKENEDSISTPSSSLQRTLQDIESSIEAEKKKLEKDNGSGSNLLQNRPTGTPKYNPTPLTELQDKKSKGQLGSKYEVALLEGPDTDGEYDPASNYSTSTTKSNNGIEGLPEYARQLSTAAGTKRKGDLTDDPESPLAKIPKFVSVDYVPTILDTSGLTDDEDNGLGELSDKTSESEITSTTGDGDGFGKNAATSHDKKSDGDSDKSILPLEFTPEGFVKTVSVEPAKKESVNRKTESVKGTHNEKKNNDSEKNSDQDCGNIFNMFKEEFDNAIEGCDPTHESKESDAGKSAKTKAISDKSHKASSHSQKHSSKSSKDAGHKSHSSSHSSSSDKSSHSSHHHKTDSHSKSHSSSSSKDKADHHRTSSHKHGEEVVKNGVHKSDKDSSKHKHTSSSSSSKSHNDSEKHSSSSSSKHSHSSHSDKSMKREHRISSSDKKSTPSKTNDKHHHERHKSGHDSHKSQDKHSSSGSHGHSHSKDRTKDKNSASSSSKSGKGKSSSHGSTSKKKHIMNLDVDLFGKADSDGTAPAGFDDDLSDFDKFFEEDPFDECLKIFNEENAKFSKPQPSTSKASEKFEKKKKTLESEITPVGKKRVALKTSDSTEKKRKLVENKPKPKPSPAQVMMNRYKQMQEKALQAEQEAKEKIKAKVREISKKNKETASVAAPSKSSSSLASAAQTFTTYISNKNKKTTAITVGKGDKRKAHTPTVPIAKLKRPVVEVSSSSKVGTNIRQRYLNVFIDEYLKMCPSEKEAFDKAKQEEECVYKRCSNKKIYLNIAVNTIKRLRTEVAAKAKDGKSSVTPKKLSHETMLGGAAAAKTSFTLHRSGGAVKLQEEDFLGAELYQRLKPYILTEDQLKVNNFPRADPEKGGCAVFYGVDSRAAKQKGSTKGYEKLCIRCGKVFEVYPNGKYPMKEECVYHWGKAWKKKIAGAIDTRYTCCQGDLSSEGCQVAKLHVHESNKKECMTGFMKTIPCSPPVDGDYGVFALDCEMVYTTMGVELARVTVVGPDEEPIYEALVMPDNAIVDFNTRFSGITEEDLEDVTTSLRDVQAVLLSLFSDKTILIGHSLESDLLALKLIHSTVVDTSIVFPHRMGLPYKRALKNLMVDHLKKIIQDDVGGHDSLEDALACLQLMQYRLKDDARKQGRRLSS